MTSRVEFPTVGELIEFLKLADPTAKLILSDPDTGWALKPTFYRDEDGVWIVSDYADKNHLVPNDRGSRW